MCCISVHFYLRHGSPELFTVIGLCLALLCSRVLACPRNSASVECFLCQEFSRCFSAEEKCVLPSTKSQPLSARLMSFALALYLTPTLHSWLSLTK